MQVHYHICRLIFISCLLFLYACNDSECDPEVDSGYCDGTTSMTCGSIYDSHEYEWKRADCGQGIFENQPYCVVGKSGAGTIIGSACSALPETQINCYESSPFCSDGSLYYCGGFGSITRIDTETGCANN